MRIAFLGTPDFAIPSLCALYNAGHELAVFTQPDRPKDRGHGIAMPPVKVFAVEHNLPVYQFERIRDSEGVAALKAFAPELMVTAAFGQILSKQNLEIPKYGCINVHGSLLPKYRGAAPVQWAIINGEELTGVTTMMTDVGLDTGDMLLKAETAIKPDETYGELYARLAEIGAELLLRTLDRLQDGSLARIPQDNSKASKCSRIDKENCYIDFSASTKRIHDLVRGLNPAPMALARLNDMRIKIISTAIPDNIERLKILQDALPGECIVADSKNGLFVKTGDGVIEIKELQFPNSRRMSAKAALNGKKLYGARFF